MITLSVRNLPRATTEESLNALFSQFGTVRRMHLVKDIFSGECKGFATIDMEGHEAREAMAALDGKELDGRVLYVSPDRPRPGKKGGRRR